MNNMKWLGIFSLAGGLIMLGYQGLESLMSEGAKFVNYTLLGTFGKEAFQWIDRVPVIKLRDGADYVIHMPIYSLLLIAGTALLIISGIFGKK